MTHTRSDFVKLTTKALVAEYWGIHANGAIPAPEPTIMQRPSFVESILGRIIFNIIDGTVELRFVMRQRS